MFVAIHGHATRSRVSDYPVTLALHLAAGLALLIGAWYVPGLALLGRRGDRTASEHFTLTWAVGCGATSLSAFTIAMLARVPLTRAMVLGCAAVWTVVGFATWPRRAASRAPASGAPAERVSAGPWLVLAFTALAALGRFHTSDLHLTCENYPTALLLGLPIGAEPRPPLLTADIEQRLGTSAIVAPTVALLGMPGFRVEYAWAITTIAGAVTHLLLAFGASPRLAFLGGFIALVFPPLAAIGEVDPNLNALAWLGVAMLLVRPGVAPRPALAGLALGLVIGRDPILAPAITVLALLACHGPGTPRRLAMAAAALVAACIPWGAHQVATYGTLLSHQSMQQFPKALPHAFLGVPFEIRAALNWPFAPHPVRSPFNPHPSALMYVQRFGTATGAVGIGLIALGAWAAWRADRRLATALIFASLPSAIALALLENWTEPTRLWLLVCLLLPALVLLPLGARETWVALRSRRLAPLFAVALVAISFRAAARAALERPPRPVDERLLDAFPGTPRERPEELVALAEQYGPPGWLPALEAEGLFRTIDAAEWRTFARQIRSPALVGQPIPLSQEVVSWIAPEWYQQRFAAPFFGAAEPLRGGEHVALVADLSIAPTSPLATVLRSPHPTDPVPLDLSGRYAPLHGAPCLPPWGEAPLETFVIGRTDNGRPLLLVFAVERDPSSTGAVAACAPDDLARAVTVPAGTFVAFFYIRQVLPTVMFQFGGRVELQGVTLQPGFRKT